MDRRFLLAGAAIAVIGVATYFFSMQGSRDGRSGRGGKSHVSGGCARSEGPDEPTAVRRAAQVPEKTVKNAELRAATRERLRERLGTTYPTAKPAPRPRATAAPAAAPAPSRPPEPEAPSTGRIEPKYIQQRVREDFFPLARQCYEQYLLRKPGAAGKMVLKFTIVGDEKIGGIVEDSSIGEDSTLRDDELDTCMSESMMAMTFPPPEGGGSVNVTYPIVFSPGDDEDNAGATGTGAGTGSQGADAGKTR